MRSDFRSRLLARIGRKYRITSVPLKFGDVCVDFVRIADPNRVLDELAEAEDRREKVEGRRKEGDELHLPYWAELWDSAVGLCEELVGRREKIVGKTLLDLGCGMGLVGTVAASLGAKVTLADLESDALLLARANAIQFDPNVRAVRLNWRTGKLDQRFDWIIGADIIYERAQWDFLEPFWRKHLAENGVVMLGEPGRPGAETFCKWMEERNWGVAVSRRTPANSEKTIRILRFNREAA